MDNVYNNIWENNVTLQQWDNWLSSFSLSKQPDVNKVLSGGIQPHFTKVKLLYKSNAAGKM